MLESAQQALAVRDGDEYFDKTGIDEAEVLSNMTAGLLATRSGCLVFVHHTVKEFLRKPVGNPKISGCQSAGAKVTQSWFTEERLAHGYIANQCLQFVALKDFLEPLSDAQRGTRAKEYPFLNYAVSNLGYHANRATALEEERYKLKQKCLALLEEGAIPLGSLQELLARIWTDPAPSLVSTLQLPKMYLAVHCNFVSPAEDLATVEIVNNTAPTQRETALDFSAQINSTKTIQLLVTKGADNCVFNSNGRTPLLMMLEALSLGFRCPAVLKNRLKKLFENMLKEHSRNLNKASKGDINNIIENLAAVNDLIGRIIIVFNSQQISKATDSLAIRHLGGLPRPSH